MGVSYQWESSLIFNGTYTDIFGATNDYYVVSSSNFTDNTYFMCKQICTSSGATNSPDPYADNVSETLNPNPLCYCHPFSGNDCSFFLYCISNFTIQGTTLNNTSDCVDSFAIAGTNNFGYFPPSLGYTTAHLSRGTTYTCSVTHDTAFAYGMNISMWIDFDGNGNYDANEYAYLGYLPADTPHVYSVTIPANAQPGLTGLRLRGHMFWALDSASACLETVVGTTQDYLVTIDTATGITNIEQGMMSVELFPNPAEKELIIKNERLIIKNVEIENVVGEKVYSLRTPNSKLPTKINVSSLTPGIYFVKVTTDRGSVVRKFIKQ